jgi:hypothetical protein
MTALRIGSSSLTVTVGRLRGSAPPAANSTLITCARHDVVEDAQPWALDEGDAR